MTQLGLQFGLEMPARVARRTNREHLERVAAAIEDVILDFCVPGRRFHATELLAYVEGALGHELAPDSPSRILRLLRRQKRVSYRVLDRRASLYEVTGGQP